MRFLGWGRSQMVSVERALVGRRDPVTIREPHLVLGTIITPPFPKGLERALFGMGCFWGVERAYWTLPGVFTTAVGYTGGFTSNPTYRRSAAVAPVMRRQFSWCSIRQRSPSEQLVRAFFEGHDPTQKMRQGNDVGTQHRSAIFTTSTEQAETAHRVADRFGESLRKPGYGTIATVICSAGEFFYAEPYHQQYLEANPLGHSAPGAPVSRARQDLPAAIEREGRATALRQRSWITFPVTSAAASEAR